jgi:hypothetical protein
MKFPQSIRDGKSPPFPAGSFVGSLSDITQDWYAADRNAPDKKDSMRFVLTLKEITPLPESPVVGARPCIQRVDIVHKGTSIVDIHDWEDSSVAFQLRQSGTLLIQLAEALGIASDNPEDDFDLNAFLEALTSGVYKNRTVGFSVEQRTYDSKTLKNSDGTAKKITASNVAGFFNPDAAAVEAVTAPQGLRTR